MELDELVGIKVKELCAKHAANLMEQAITEANNAARAPDTLMIISLLRAANIVRRMGHNATRT